MSKGVQIAIATACVFGALAWFITTETAGEGSFRYYRTVEDYLEKGPEDTGPALRASRVHGFVLEGSIEKDLRAGVLEFVIQDHTSAQLPVRYHGGDVPDLFKDGAEIVVEGHLADGVFVADRMMAKCPSKYEAREEPGAET